MQETKIRINITNKCKVGSEKDIFNIITQIKQRANLDLLNPTR